MGRVFHWLAVLAARILLWCAKQLSTLAFRIVSRDEAAEIFPDFVEANVSMVRQVFHLKPFKLNLGTVRVKRRNFTFGRMTFRRRKFKRSVALWV